MSSSGQFGSVIPDFADIRRLQGTTATPLTNPADFQSLGTIETKLLANGYSQSTLNVMTLNDKIYALRLFEEAAGIK